MAHTPGPWHISLGSADYVSIEAAEQDNLSWPIQVAYIELEEHGAKPTEEQLANAYILAAAPDMLAACEALVKRVNNLASSGALIRRLDALALMDPIEQVRAALAKAKPSLDGSS